MRMNPEIWQTCVRNLFIIVSVIINVIYLTEVVFYKSQYLISIAKRRPPMIITPEEDQAIVAEVERTPFTKTVQIRERLGLACSVRKWMKEEVFKHRVAAVKGKFIHLSN